MNTSRVSIIAAGVALAVVAPELWFGGLVRAQSTMRLGASVSSESRETAVILERALSDLEQRCGSYPAARQTMSKRLAPLRNQTELKPLVTESATWLAGMCSAISGWLSAHETLLKTHLDGFERETPQRYEEPGLLEQYARTQEHVSVLLASVEVYLSLRFDQARAALDALRLTETLNRQSRSVDSNTSIGREVLAGLKEAQRNTQGHFAALSASAVISLQSVTRDLEVVALSRHTPQSERPTQSIDKIALGPEKPAPSSEPPPEAPKAGSPEAQWDAEAKAADERAKKFAQLASTRYAEAAEIRAEIIAVEQGKQPPQVARLDRALTTLRQEISKTRSAIANTDLEAEGGRSEAARLAQEVIDKEKQVKRLEDEFALATTPEVRARWIAGRREAMNDNLKQAQGRLVAASEARSEARRARSRLTVSRHLSPLLAARESLKHMARISEARRRLPDIQRITFTMADIPLANMERVPAAELKALTNNLKSYTALLDALLGQLDSVLKGLDSAQLMREQLEIRMGLAGQAPLQTRTALLDACLGGAYTLTVGKSARGKDAEILSSAWNNANDFNLTQLPSLKTLKRVEKALVGFSRPKGKHISRMTALIKKTMKRGDALTAGQRDMLLADIQVTTLRNAERAWMSLIEQTTKQLNEALAKGAVTLDGVSTAHAGRLNRTAQVRSGAPITLTIFYGDRAPKSCPKTTLVGVDARWRITRQGAMCTYELDALPATEQSQLTLRVLGK